MSDSLRNSEGPARKTPGTILRVLVAEDEFLVAVLLEEDLRSSGYDVVGPFTDLAGAVKAANAMDFDVAVLDINLKGEMVYPLAEDLLARGIPFVFLSGYAAADLPAEFRNVSRIAKPYDISALASEIERVTRR